MAEDFLRYNVLDDNRAVVAFNGYADDGWAYGLAGAGAAADLGAPLNIVGNTVPPETQDYVVCGEEVEILLLGGPGQISQTTVDQLSGQPSG